LLGDVERRRQPFGGIVGGADRAHLAGPHQRVERPERLLERRLRIVLMGVIKIDRLDPEPAQRGLRRRLDMRGGKPACIADLGRDHDVPAAAPLQPFADQGLRFAAFVPRNPRRIDVGRVDERPARLGEAVEDGEGFVASRRPAEHIAAEHEPRRR
jgi:hypothetical protein